MFHRTIDLIFCFIEPIYIIRLLKYLVSINYDGKCEHCGKGSQRITVDVHIHDIPGTRGSEEWCLECVRGMGKEKTAQKGSGKMTRKRVS